jgi:hypothetical protein
MTLLADAAARRVPIDDLVASLRSDDEDLAALAAAALGETGLEPIATALAGRLESARSAGLVRACVHALAGIPGAGARNALTDVFAREEDASRRADALMALGARADADQSRLAFACGAHDTEAVVRLVADRYLAGLRPDPDSTPATAAMTKPSFASVAREAVRILSTARDLVTAQALPRRGAGTIDVAALDAAAMRAMASAFETPGRLQSEGCDRLLLQRLIASSILTAPDQAMGVAAELPFTCSPGDLIELTTAALRGMVESLNDPFARVLSRTTRRVARSRSGRPSCSEATPGLRDWRCAWKPAPPSRSSYCSDRRRSAPA